jgi:hypothetical protein
MGRKRSGRFRAANPSIMAVPGCAKALNIFPFSAIGNAAIKIQSSRDTILETGNSVRKGGVEVFLELGRGYLIAKVTHNILAVMSIALEKSSICKVEKSSFN